MNDKSLDVLKQYELNVYQVNRGRGGMVLGTNLGIKLFLECQKPDKYYEREDAITQALVVNGFPGVDTFVKNEEGMLVSVAEDGRRYMLKNWFDGRECNVKCIDDVFRTVEILAHLHCSLKKVETSWREDNNNKIISLDMENPSEVHAASAMSSDATPMKDTYIRHMRELKLAGNYLKNKKNKSEFEQIAYKNIGSYYNEAVEAVKKMDSQILRDKFIDAKENGELCHGSYNYHNVMFGNMEDYVTNFDKYKNECQISDLYQFMRKILEKYNWNMEIAYKMMDEYDRVKPLSDSDLELLTVMFEFPEKFWKVINFYFNGSKSWIPRKSIEKLKTVVEQNNLRLNFLQTLA